MSLKPASLTCFYFLASIFAALASYRMHIEGLETAVFPIFEAITDMTGRAPDQYRILPYLLIGALRELFSLVSGVTVTPKYPVIVFDAAFLFFSVLLLAMLFRKPNIHLINTALIVIYPYLMFDGYRPIESFILFLSVLSMALMMREPVNWRKPVFMLLLVIFAFTRADVALLFALISISYMSYRLWELALVVTIPLAIQLLLSRVIFADAEYFSQVIMLMDNFSGRFLLASPLSYLLLGTLLLRYASVKAFILENWRNRRGVIACLAGYGLLLFVIARPNEFRLFLPMLPVVLSLIYFPGRQSGS